MAEGRPQMDWCLSRRCFPKQNTHAVPKSHMQVKSQASVNSWGPTFSALLLDKGLGYLGDPTLLQRLWETGPQGLSSLHVREHCRNAGLAGSPRGGVLRFSPGVP